MTPNGHVDFGWRSAVCLLLWSKSPQTDQSCDYRNPRFHRRPEASTTGVPEFTEGPEFVSQGFQSSWRDWGFDSNSPEFTTVLESWLLSPRVHKVQHITGVLFPGMLMVLLSPSQPQLTPTTELVISFISLHHWTSQDIPPGRLTGNNKT